MRTGEGPVLTARYVVYATGYEMPTAVRPAGHTVHSTYAMATQPQPAKLWPEHCHIWEAATPYLYARTTPDGRVICGGEDEPFQDEEQRDALLAPKTARLAAQTPPVISPAGLSRGLCLVRLVRRQPHRLADHRRHS